jgi:hypothetical protein
MNDDDIPEQEMLNAEETLTIWGVAVRRIGRAVVKSETAVRDFCSAMLTLPGEWDDPTAHRD